jgi:phage terminase large subunit GpA-like protein
MVSTPTIKGASNIEREYLAGDQRQYYVPCPHCQHMQVLAIENLILDVGQFACVNQNCGQLIHESAKTEMLARGEWRPNAPQNTRRSYHIWAAYAPAGLGDTWLEIARMKRKADRDPVFAKTFTNTVLGLPFEMASNAVDEQSMRTGMEAWACREVPEDALLITAGIDVQHNRFAVLIVGWGPGDHCWMIDYAEIPGDPTQRSDWDHLTEHVFTPLVLSNGVSILPERIAIDSGNWTHEVYAWARQHSANGVIATKGEKSLMGPLIAAPTLQDINALGEKIIAGVKLYKICVRVAKDSLIPRLIKPRDATDWQPRVHFPRDISPTVFDHLSAEVFDLATKRWTKRTGHTRNEALDCWVNAFAAACHPVQRLHLLRDADWKARRAARLEAPKPTPAPPPPVTAQRSKPKFKRNL